MAETKKERKKKKAKETDVLVNTLSDIKKNQALVNICSTVAGSLYTILINIMEHKQFFIEIENPRKKAQKEGPSEKLNEKPDGKLIFENKRNKRIYSAYLELISINFTKEKKSALPFLKVSTPSTSLEKEEYAFYGAPVYTSDLIQLLEDKDICNRAYNIGPKLEELLDIDVVAKIVDVEMQRMMFDLTGQRIELKLEHTEE